LVGAYIFLRTFLQLSHIPHYTTTLQKFAARINGILLLWKIISSFILLLLTNIGKIFTGIDSTGFKEDN
jgi:hypothetical protein